MTQQYRTANSLGISPEEHAGLIKLKAYFENEATSPPNLAYEDADVGNVVGELTTRLGFSMSFPTRRASDENPYHCGCVACIGGHLSLLLQGVDVISGTAVRLTPVQTALADAYVSRNEYGVMGELFYPREDQVVGNWNGISAASAAAAIGNFLTTGEPRWDLALAANGQNEFIRED